MKTASKFLMVGGIEYRIDTMERVAEAHRAMISAGVAEAPVMARAADGSVASSGRTIKAPQKKSR
jgi:hypothetical protein